MELDAEIKAMTMISDALSTLDDDARVRVLRWAADRYASTSLMNASVWSSLENQEKTLDVENFSHISELFDAASPSSQPEMALVGCYWFQVVEEQGEIDAQAVNSSLKQLGHGISNITQALTSLQTRKPALLMQLQKKGSSQQARKRYKLTTPGIQAVEDMVTDKGA